MKNRVDLWHPLKPDVRLFSHEELACPRTNKVKLGTGFVNELIDLRMAYDRPMTVTSGCRSMAYNTTLPGASKRSLHIYDFPQRGGDGCYAIDIARTGGVNLWRLVYMAMERGWSIGIARTFVHLDQRKMLGESPVIFGY